MNLIERLKNQEIILVPELPGNLRPHGAYLLPYLGILLVIHRSSLDVKPIFAVTPVMMYVYNRIQPCIFSISHNLGNPVKPVIVNLILRSLSELSEPGHRYAHRLVACRLDLIEQCLSSLRIAPYSLSRNTIVVSIKLISEIPPHAELVQDLPCGIILRLRHGLCPLCLLAHLDIFLFITGNHGNARGPFFPCHVLIYRNSDGIFVRRSGRLC